ncbi:MAG TPA: precorrin-2 C(20)-methyltransferase [Acidimicrobiales bacterium]|nr:precorrin-2 C(20)-methyltransferase [Acidimicrobiales bacterium]
MAGGRLIGVGVGPGDPQLITLKALGALEAADRVVAPTSSAAEQGRAEAVVRSVLPNTRVSRVAFDMSGGDDHRQAHQLLPWLEAGETVAFVTLGDPNMYSTFASIARRVRQLSPSTEVDTVPGIMAFQDLAARCGRPLATSDDCLYLVTGLSGTADLERALAAGRAAVVVYKGGRHLPEVARALERAGRLEGAVVGERLGLAGERVGPVSELRWAPAGYLATVVVPPPERR